MLIELPAADEIDDLAITTPKFEVRKFEFNLAHSKANLNYPPCKAHVVIVVKGRNGTALSQAKDGAWSLPSGRVGAAEEIPHAVKRVATEDFGLMLRSLDLAGIYDVIWHYSDLTIKRLHFVYAAVTDDEPQPNPKNKVGFFTNAEEMVEDDISKAALTDSKEK